LWGREEIGSPSEEVPVGREGLGEAPHPRTDPDPSPPSFLTNSSLNLELN
jgi:hypothetical protein